MSDKHKQFTNQEPATIADLEKIINASRYRIDIQPNGEIRSIDLVEERDTKIAELQGVVDKLLADLRWHGHTIAGGGPMTGYEKAARKAEEHWYKVSLELCKAAERAKRRTMMSGSMRGSATARSMPRRRREVNDD